MVVGFNLHQQMHGFLAITIFFTDRIGIKTPALSACDYGRIVRIGRENIFAINTVGMADHRKQ